MSKAEILAEIPKLTKKERFEIRVKLAAMDSDGWLDEDDLLRDAEKKLNDERLAEHEAQPTVETVGYGRSSLTELAGF